MSGSNHSTPTKFIEKEGFIKDDVPTPPVYYGICVSDATTDIQDEKPLVFLDKEEVLKEIKKYPGARFKAFSSQLEAYSYSTDSNKSFVSTPVECVQNVEKPLAFRAPSRQVIQKLRRAIEQGDVQYFSSAIWSNPRHLIAGCDTPTIIQEGCRYTTLHVAAKFNQPEICKLILKAMQDIKFLQLLYEDDPISVQERRMEFLTDLYLNLPDKGSVETPLHFACKFGCAKVVEILLSYPACERNRTNKYDQTARQIICERCATPNRALKREIDNLFEDKYFVSVLRSEDNSLVPVLGKPFFPEECSLTQMNTDSPAQSALKIQAVAGPMSPELATQFYKEWKGPSTPVSRSNCKPKSMVKRTDSGKGLERIGRALAEKHQVHWNEFWPFLEGWCNFATPSGLMKLEKHFEEVNKKLIQDNLRRVTSKLLETSGHLDATTPETKTCHSSKNPLTPQEKEVEFSPVTKLCKELENFHISSLTKDPCKLINSSQRPAINIPQNDNVRRILNFDSPRTSHNVQIEKERLRNDGAVNSHLQEKCDRASEAFYTPPSSPSRFECPFHTPEEFQSFFIMGPHASKVDFDVFNALECVAVDASTYPLVFLWKENIRLVPSDQFSSVFTPKHTSVANSSFCSVPSYETSDCRKSRQPCWTFPVKKKLSY